MADEEFVYLPRLADARLAAALENFPAIIVRGPKWCGKTSTCEQTAASALKLRDPDVYLRSVEAAQIRPSLLLRGDTPRLLDEWQLIPVLWDAVTSEADARHGTPGQFMLTGSATPPGEDERKHTGTGRIARLNMLPMSLEESGESTGEVSLSVLFSEDGPVEGASGVTIEEYARLICRGGWPAPIAQGFGGMAVARNYIDAICESDLSEASESTIDPDRARSLLRSLARNISQEASYPTLIEDCKAFGMGMSEPTLRTYLNALGRIFVVDKVRHWAPTLRSRTPLRSAGAWQFCDPSLAAAALEADGNALLSDLITMGYLFESLCVRDLRVYAANMDGGVYRYRDKSGLEVDAIVRLRDGAWGAIEVKLGGAARIEEGASSLRALASKVDTAKTGEPAFLMVLTGGQYAYTRPDGVHVVPLACLKS